MQIQSHTRSQSRSKPKCNAALNNMRLVHVVMQASTKRSDFGGLKSGQDLTSRQKVGNVLENTAETEVGRWKQQPEVPGPDGPSPGSQGSLWLLFIINM